MKIIKKLLSRIQLSCKVSKSDKHWNLPPLSLLSSYLKSEVNNDLIKRDSKAIEGVLENNNVSAKTIKIDQAPAFTRYLVKVQPGNDLSRLLQLSNDITLATASPYKVRMEIVSKKDGLLTMEIPNENPEAVPLKRMIEQYEKLNLNYKLPVPLGVDGENKEQFADFVDLKHILMGGQTGSGKSVFAHSLINFLLLRFSPEDLRILLVDMKRVEFPLTYNGLPYLITDCLMDSELTTKWLRRVLDEKKRSKNIKPYTLIVIDTSSDIMCSNYRNDFINLVNEILINGSALGIYLVMFDSRVGEEVFNPLFISGFNTIICFTTADKAGSKLLINSEDGADYLLGRGDMLLLKKDQPHPVRLQAPYISGEEIERIVDFINSKN